MFDSQLLIDFSLHFMFFSLFRLILLLVLDLSFSRSRDNLMDLFIYYFQYQNILKVRKFGKFDHFLNFKKYAQVELEAHELISVYIGTIIIFLAS